MLEEIKAPSGFLKVSTFRTVTLDGNNSALHSQTDASSSALSKLTIHVKFKQIPAITEKNDQFLE
jgi:hypothetical protein